MDPSLAGNPAPAFLLVLVVVIGALGAFALYARRLRREADAMRTNRDEPGTLELWACASCGQANVASRDACFACQAPRDRA